MGPLFLLSGPKVRKEKTMTYNYKNAKFFNYENYRTLCAKIGEGLKSNAPNAERIHDLVENTCAQTFLDYVKTVDMSETRIIIAHNRLEGEDLRDAVETIDRGRTAVHNAAAEACNIINRMAAANGVEPVFTGNSSDRLQVADFCLEFTVEIFKNRRK